MHQIAMTGPGVAEAKPKAIPKYLFIIHHDTGEMVAGICPCSSYERALEVGRMIRRRNHPVEIYLKDETRKLPAFILVRVIKGD